MATLVDWSLGLGLESTWNVSATPDHFYEWLESSGGDFDPNTIDAKGLRQGSRFPRASRHTQLVPKASVKLNFELASKGFGLPLSAWFGTGVSTLVAAGLYQQLFTAYTAGSYLPSLTAQMGLIRADGTIDPVTWRGCQVKSGSLTMPTNGLVELSLDCDARAMHATRVVADATTTTGQATLTSATALFVANDIGSPVSGPGIPVGATIVGVSSPTTATMSASATATGATVTVTIGQPYVTPTYPAGATIFSSAVALTTSAVVMGGTLTAPTTTALGTITGGVAAASVKTWELSLDNGLDMGRDIVGGRNRATTGMRKGSLKTTVEYDSSTGVVLRDAMISQTPMPLLLTAQTPEQITPGNPATFQVAATAAVPVKGAIPQPTAGTVATTSVEWTVLDNLTQQPLYALLRTADTAL